MPSKFTFIEKIQQNFILALADKDFRNDIIALRNQYGIPIGGFKNFKGWERWSEKKSFGKYKDALNALRIKYNLSEPYHQFLVVLVESGKIILAELINEKGFSRGYKIHLLQTKKNGNQMLIEIYPETTIKDLENNFNQIIKTKNNFFTNKVQRQKIRKDKLLNLYLAIYSDLGVSQKQLARVFRKFFGTKQFYYHDVASKVAKTKRAARTLLKR